MASRPLPGATARDGGADLEIEIFVREGRCSSSRRLLASATASQVRSVAVVEEGELSDEPGDRTRSATPRRRQAGATSWEKGGRPVAWTRVGVDSLNRSRSINIGRRFWGSVGRLAGRRGRASPRGTTRGSGEAG